MILRHLPKALLSCWLIILPALAAHTSEQLDLRYKIKGSSPPEYEVQIEQSVKTDAPDTPSMVQHLKRRLLGLVEFKQTKRHTARLKSDVHFDRFKVEQSLDGNIISQPGVRDLRDFILTLDIGDKGPADIHSLTFKKTPDAMVYSRLQPVVEILQWCVLTGLPTLPEGSPVKGDEWSSKRALPAAIPGAPGLSFEIKSTYRFAGVEKCGSRRCVIIEEKIEVDYQEQRSLAARLLQIRVEGKGTGRYSFQVDSGVVETSNGRVSLVVGLISLSPDGKLGMNTRSRIDLSVKQKLK